jgi:hypothetical protein
VLRYVAYFSAQAAASSDSVPHMLSKSLPMDLSTVRASLGLVGMFLGNELCFALATESYGVIYGAMRVAVIPVCSSLLIAGSIVRWWRAQRGFGERSKQPLWHLAGALVGGSIWAFQWFSSWTLLPK